MGFVDRRIHQSMIDGLSIFAIKQDIETRYTNMSNVLTNKDISVDEFEELLRGDIEKIESSRIKYTAFYVRHARKRLFDLDWLLSNKSRFPKYSNSQIFNLIKLRDKLQPKTELSV